MLILERSEFKMSFNPETFSLMLKLLIGMIVILLLIWLIAVFTPKLAKIIDKLFGKTKIDLGDSSITLENGEKYTVRSIFEGERTDEPSAEPPKTANNNENNNEKE